MRAILLGSSGFHATLVDDDDWEWLIQSRWHLTNCNGKLYAVRREGGRKAKNVYMHRVILGLSPGDPQVDHKDGDGLNNQRDNLRLATQGDNNHNRADPPGKSGYRGVNWWKPCQKGKGRGRWRATISVGNKTKHLGLFHTAEEAARAYDAAARAIHGEFARLNF